MTKNLLSALIVTTPTALNGFRSGASMRVAQIEGELSSLGFNIKKVPKNQISEIGQNRFDVIVLCSYSAAYLGRWARKRTDFLWYDPYDSWIRHRLSLLKGFHVWQFPLLLRDIFFAWRFPYCDLITFISKVDADRHTKFCREKKVFIMPLVWDSHVVEKSSEPRFVFIGDGKFLPNRLAVEKLHRLGSKHGLKFFIIGRGYPKDMPLGVCEFLGYLPDSNLYRTLDIHVSPGIPGAGIKSKVVMALAAGLRVVSCRADSSGVRPHPNLVVVDDEEALVTAMFETSNNWDWKYQGPQLDIYEVDDSASLRRTLETELRNLKP